jgi:carbon storage regulator
MLVLSRRAGQKIVIGNEIIVEIVSISGDSVRLGITAPHETSVHRFEVFTEIQQANKDAELASASLEPSALENLSALVRTKQKP